MKSGKTFNHISLIFAILSASVCLCIRLLTNSPYEMIHRLNCTDLFPPIWLFNALSVIWSILTGLAVGAVVGCRPRGNGEIQAYRGGLFFLASFFLSACWYPVFFGSGRVFVALILSFVAVICSALCVCSWVRVSPQASLIIAAHTLWLAYTVFLLFRILLQN
ncbi:MAG: tryptophan-rich sensory protein [Clostridia bacterium]|nr:tryptophan-rich sensory protein [Clostridia bacterium]